jgi:hypothetical protein
VVQFEVVELLLNDAMIVVDAVDDGFFSFPSPVI